MPQEGTAAESGGGNGNGITMLEVLEQQARERFGSQFKPESGEGEGGRQKPKTFRRGARRTENGRR